MAKERGRGPSNATQIWAVPQCGAARIRRPWVGTSDSSWGYRQGGRVARESHWGGRLGSGLMPEPNPLPMEFAAHGTSARSGCYDDVFECFGARVLLAIKKASPSLLPASSVPSRMSSA